MSSRESNRRSNGNHTETHRPDSLRTCRKSGPRHTSRDRRRSRSRDTTRRSRRSRSRDGYTTRNTGNRSESYYESNSRLSHDPISRHQHSRSSNHVFKQRNETMDDFYSRLASMRQNKEANVWPTSPKTPERPFDLSPILSIEPKIIQTPLSSSSSSNDSSSEFSESNKRKRRRRKSSDKRLRSVSQPNHNAEEESKDKMHQERVIEEEFVGPLPVNSKEIKLDDRAYGTDLLYGEGSAMAAYLQSGKRIPRRGEVGRSHGEIESLEAAGYVMSGNRNKNMNAVRMRKENQVISAEEMKALMIFNQQEKMRKEAEILSNFKEIVNQRVQKIEESEQKYK